MLAFQMKSPGTNTSRPGRRYWKTWIKFFGMNSEGYWTVPIRIYLKSMTEKAMALEAKAGGDA
jgi:hypothetical protein